MRRFAFLSLAALAMASCNEPKAGQPVVTVDLDDETAPLSETADGAATPATAGLSPETSVCSPVSFETVDLTHCVADPDKHAIGVVYGPAGSETPYGTLGTFARTADAATIVFAMNGGAFSDDLKPRGYLVTSGDRLAELDRGSGDSNFHMKPNGVFFGSNGRWRVLATNRFFSTVRERPRFGTQSGPMLLVDGELGAAISENGNSRAIRNAVGVSDDGKAHFVITNAPLSFGQLARFYRDELGVKNALFLDSNSSSLWNPATGRLDTGRTGPILVVTKKGAS
ncbi:MAG: phosphodiester glycosidase family protein [Pseudomonadota bacterium]